MSNVDTTHRKMFMRETDDNFYLAVDKPYRQNGRNWKKLLYLTHHGSVFTLESGNQVFVHPRDQYDPSDEGMEIGKAFTDTDLFSERVVLTAQQIGRVSIDPVVQRVEDKMISQKFMQLTSV